MHTCKKVQFTCSVLFSNQIKIWLCLKFPQQAECRASQNMIPLEKDGLTGVRPKVNREVLFIEVSLKCYPEDIFHPAKFDNFKDEKISDYRTVSVPQRKNFLD